MNMVCSPAGGNAHAGRAVGGEVGVKDYAGTPGRVCCHETQHTWHPSQHCANRVGCRSTGRRRCWVAAGGGVLSRPPQLWGASPPPAAARGRAPAPAVNRLQPPPGSSPLVLFWFAYNIWPRARALAAGLRPPCFAPLRTAAPQHRRVRVRVRGAAAARGALTCPAACGRPRPPWACARPAPRRTRPSGSPGKAPPSP